MKKITKIEVIFHTNEACIWRINLFSGEERIAKVGFSDQDIEIMSDIIGRREFFEIAADEQLIGAELYHGDFTETDREEKDCFCGLTWLKCKIAE